MTIWESIILGIVEGVTEYLPVSSTGHLLVTQHLMGIPDNDASKAFAVCIQGGAILAVLGLYFQRVKSMTMGILGKNPAGLKLLINLIIAFAPAVVIGLIFDDWIKDVLFGMKPIMISWIVGGAAILIFAWKREKAGDDVQKKSLDDMTPVQAFIIGMLQCVAMWPGTSRSLMTMLGGLFVGMSMAAAVEFSFLLGLITLSAATCYDAYKHGADMVTTYGVESLATGTIAAWVAAVIAIKWMVSYLQKHSLSIFGYYRIVAGITLAFLIIKGIV